MSTHSIPPDFVPTLSDLAHLVDLILSLTWFAAFGLLVHALDSLPCGSPWDWSGLAHSDDCSRLKAAEAFSFLSAIFWLASAVLVCFLVVVLAILLFRRLLTLTSLSYRASISSGLFADPEGLREFPFPKYPTKSFNYEALCPY
jgi:occludin/MAL family lipid-associated protein